MMASGDDEKFGFAEASAAQRERDGFYWLGWCFKFGFFGWGEEEENLDQAKEKYLVAADLGHVEGMANCGALLDEIDPQCWFWLGRAAQRGQAGFFLSNFCDAVFEFNSGSGSAARMFQIGRALNGNVDVEKEQIFGESDDFDSWIGPANEAIASYKSQLAAYKRAVDTWTLVGIRNHVVKDIRILISNMIWEWRDFALYTV